MGKTKSRIRRSRKSRTKRSKRSKVTNTSRRYKRGGCWSMKATSWKDRVNFINSDSEAENKAKDENDIKKQIEIAENRATLIHNNPDPRVKSRYKNPNFIPVD